MEEERTKSEGLEGCWVVARCAGGHYIGRVTRILLTDVGYADMEKATQEELGMAKSIKLDPGYEFVCQPQIAATPQGPTMTGKFFFAMAVGASVKDGPVYLNMAGGMIQPLSLLHEVDIETYTGLVKLARQQMDESYQHMVASRAGIVLTGKMPENRGDGNKFRA